MNSKKWEYHVECNEITLFDNGTFLSSIKFSFYVVISIMMTMHLHDRHERKFVIALDTQDRVVVCK